MKVTSVHKVFTLVEYTLFNAEINECGLVDNCAENALCYNTPGSFICTCREGYFGNGTQCTCMTGYTDNGTSCEGNISAKKAVGIYTLVEYTSF